ILSFGEYISYLSQPPRKGVSHGWEGEPQPISHLGTSRGSVPESRFAVQETSQRTYPNK
ncbi:9589_t:CDS:2, partial [Racocetra persica]